MIDLPNEADIVTLWCTAPGRKLLVASTAGDGFLVPEDEVVAQTRAGKQVLNVKDGVPRPPSAPVAGDHVAVVSEEPQVPRLPAGRAARDDARQGRAAPEVQDRARRRGCWNSTAGSRTSRPSTCREGPLLDHGRRQDAAPRRGPRRLDAASARASASAAPRLPQGHEVRLRAPWRPAPPPSFGKPRPAVPAGAAHGPSDGPDARHLPLLDEDPAPPLLLVLGPPRAGTRSNTPASRLEKLLGFLIAVVALAFYIGIVNLILMWGSFAL
jgi:hypothetical protein